MDKEIKLDKIDEGLLRHLSETVNKGTSDGSTPLEAILKLNGDKRPGRRKTALPKTPPVVDIDGLRLYQDPTTMMFYKLVKLNDPKVDAILLEANFSMADIQARPIFPRSPVPEVQSPEGSPLLPSQDIPK